MRRDSIAACLFMERLLALASGGAIIMVSEMLKWRGSSYSVALCIGSIEGFHFGVQLLISLLGYGGRNILAALVTVCRTVYVFFFALEQCISVCILVLILLD